MFTEVSDNGYDHPATPESERNGHPHCLSCRQPVRWNQFEHLWVHMYSKDYNANVG